MFQVRDRMGKVDRAECLAQFVDDLNPTMQGDILKAAYASHGDCKHVCLYPDSVAEAYEFAHGRTLGVTIMFGAMVLVTYTMFVSMARPVEIRD